MRAGAAGAGRPGSTLPAAGVQHLEEALQLAPGPAAVEKSGIVVVALQEQTRDSEVLLQLLAQLHLHQAERLAAAVGVEHDAVDIVEAHKLREQIVAPPDLDVQEPVSYTHLTL